jgi:hypothetical protein
LDLTKKQLAALEKANAKEVVTLERKVAEERSLREQIEKRVLNLANSIKSSGFTTQVSQLKSLSKAEDLEVGKEQFAPIVGLLSVFEEQVKKTEQSSIEEVTKLFVAIKERL